MAIYSLRLKPIGRTTQKKPFTAASHIRYITRKEALTLHMAKRMPEEGPKAIRWYKEQERNDRENARVANKMILALPKELTLEQQAQLVQNFAEELTQQRASWFAAIHAKGKDADNPHCHLIVRDRDVVTGRRVVMFSAGAKEMKEKLSKGQKTPTTLRMIREMWSRQANGALEAAGRPERIDHRTLVEQGISRPAQVHEGPNIRAMHRRGYRPKSAERVVRNGANRKKGAPATRVVRYQDIDHGRTRAEYNDSLRPTTRLTLTERARLRARGRVAEEPVRSRTDRGRTR